MFLDIIFILAWNAYRVRCMISVIPLVFIWDLQCDINETMILGTARS